MTSPLGKYSDVAATIVGVGVVVVWLAIHAALILADALGHVLPITPDTSQVDLAATLVLGVVLGQRAATNGAGQIASAANVRLDAIGAPSAAAITAGQVTPAPPADPTAVG